MRKRLGGWFSAERKRLTYQMIFVADYCETMQFLYGLGHEVWLRACSNIWQMTLSTTTPTAKVRFGYLQGLWNINYIYMCVYARQVRGMFGVLCMTCQFALLTLALMLCFFVIRLYFVYPWMYCKRLCAYIEMTLINKMCPIITAQYFL